MPTESRAAPDRRLAVHNRTYGGIYSQQVRNVFFLFVAAQTALTAVAGNELTSAVETVDRQDTVVCTTLAARHRRLVGQA